MICDDNSCGTGGGNIPKPGDPNNNGVLSATPAFGGIDINWTFPTTNPFAVAYTTIYRALSSDFVGAILLAPQVGGGFYYDPVDPGIEYFYWITFVSINGTVGDVIGPVSAVARSSIDKTIQDLTGRIDSGVLAQELKEEIGGISTNADRIRQEVLDRLAAEQGISVTLLQTQEYADISMTAVIEETKQRKDADSAVVESINILYAQAGGATAAIAEEARIRAEKDLALAQQITTVTTTLQGNISTVQSELRAEIAVVDGRVTAVSTKVDTVENTLGSEIAQVQVQMETKIDTVNGKVTQIGALYTAKVNVNGLIGGFGVYNDGTEVQAGFDVDTFWVGRTNANKKKPFIIVGGEVFIDQAVINQLTFSKLRADDGSVIVENGKLKVQYLDADNIVARKINVEGLNGQGARTTIVGGLTSVFYPSGNLCLRLGVW